MEKALTESASTIPVTSSAMAILTNPRSSMDVEEFHGDGSAGLVAAPQPRNEFDGIIHEMPLQAVSPATMVTPDGEQMFLHDPLLLESIVPSEKKRFKSRDEPYEFYCFYAGKAGFDVRITKTKKTVLELSCSRQGKCEFYKPGEQRVCGKMSKRCKCRKFVKVKWNQRKRTIDHLTESR